MDKKNVKEFIFKLSKIGFMRSSLQNSGMYFGKPIAEHYIIYIQVFNLGQLTDINKKFDIVYTDVTAAPTPNFILVKYIIKKK